MVLTSASNLLINGFREDEEQLLRLQSVIDQDLCAIDQLALHRHQTDGHLGAADVDSDNNVATDDALLDCLRVDGRWVDFVS